MDCYVNHPKSGAVMPPHLTRENTLFYPEATMTAFECYTSGRPRDYHIMTDCPDLVALYDRQEVFLWDVGSGCWVHPDSQTYGADISIIRLDCFGIRYQVHAVVISRESMTNVMGHPLPRKARR